MAISPLISLDLLDITCVYEFVSLWMGFSRRTEGEGEEYCIVLLNNWKT